MTKASRAKSSAANNEEKHHKYRCRDLKRQLEELEEYNERLAVKLLRSQKRLRRMKIERNLLLDRLENGTQRNSDSGSDSDIPLKDSVNNRIAISDIDPEQQLSTRSTARQRRKVGAQNQQQNTNNATNSVYTTPRHISHNSHLKNDSVNSSATSLSNNTTHSTTLSTGPGTANRKRSERDPNAPKRPANAFVLFCQVERPNIKSSGPELSSSELTKIMSVKWKELPQAEKKEFYELYEREMARYHKEMETYNNGNGAPASNTASANAANTKPSNTSNNISGNAATNNDAANDGASGLVNNEENNQDASDTNDSESVASGGEAISPKKHARDGNDEGADKAPKKVKMEEEVEVNDNKGLAADSGSTTQSQSNGVHTNGIDDDGDEDDDRMTLPTPEADRKSDLGSRINDEAEERNDRQEESEAALVPAGDQTHSSDTYTTGSSSLSPKASRVRSVGDSGCKGDGVERSEIVQKNTGVAQSTAMAIDG